MYVYELIYRNWHNCFSFLEVEFKNTFKKISGTEIECDTSHQDDHSPKNLTSSNYELKKRGFLVDYFVRPPVSLTFKFEHPIWISHICLETHVGQQKTKGIDIFVNDDVDNRIARSINSNLTNKQIIFQNFRYPGNKYNFHCDKDKVSKFFFSLYLSQIACEAQIWLPKKKSEHDSFYG